MPRKNRPIPELSDAEEAAIQAQIAEDPDSPELTEEDFARLRPAQEVLPPDLYASLTRSKGGRPKSDVTKVPVTLRVDPDTLAAYKATGAGWQTRMNEVLRKGKPKASPLQRKRA
jgi:uncharacterized protein (DUF4415 family)